MNARQWHGFIMDMVKPLIAGTIYLRADPEVWSQCKQSTAHSLLSSQTPEDKASTSSTQEPPPTLRSRSFFSFSSAAAAAAPGSSDRPMGLVIQSSLCKAGAAASTTPSQKGRLA